ncbi:glutathione S-transferase C-terminal domain-containing protein [Acetobacter sp. DsW_063]|uniref:glutathione S-transferase C-terminal domain-containing protein n=1 Tax=Acetobacter sp. DsW_063 TaxID=1514894 RepID=UPI0018E9AA08|nr:glutathione S-transferase C-terminal domain-containing protein [Acetobacter sp. DsW_063]
MVRTAPKDQDPAAIERAIAILDRFLSIADARLSRHAYLAGDDFTLADIQFGHTLFR